MRILFCVVLILSALISHLNAINKDTLKKFFSDEEKYSLKDMHKILTDINSYTFIQYSESIFTVMGQGIDVKKWDVMIDGFVAFNSLNKETGTHLKTLKYNEFQVYLFIRRTSLVIIPVNTNTNYFSPFKAFSIQNILVNTNSG